MKLIASNPIVHGDVANYKAMVYKMILPSDLSQPPTIELYKRGVTVSQYTPNFGNGIPADFYTSLHTVQIDWEIEGGYDTCFFGVIYHKGWLLGSPVVFTDMHYNTRTGSGSRELVMYRADGVIDDENNPKPYPDTHVVINHNSEIFADTRPWDFTLNHVHVIEEQPIDTFLKIRVICGHTFTYNAVGVQNIESKQMHKFFVPDNYEGSGDGGGCGCGGGSTDLSQLMARFDNLDAAVSAVKQDTNSTLTLANNIEYLSNEIQDRVDRIDQGMPAGFTMLGTKVDTQAAAVGVKVDAVGKTVDRIDQSLPNSFNTLGAKVDLVGSKVDTQATAVGSKVDAVGLKVDTADGKVTALDTKVTAQATTLGQKIDTANTAITSLDGKVTTDGNLTRTAVTKESTAIQGKVDAIDMSAAGVPQHVIDMIMDLHAEALGSWSWNKRTSILTMFDTHGIEVATFSVTDTPDVASRERRTDLEVS